VKKAKVTVVVATIAAAEAETEEAGKLFVYPSFS